MDTGQRRSHQPIQVLIVDSDAATRQQVRATLRYRDEILIAGEAGNGHEALEALETVAVDVALIGPAFSAPEALATCRRVTAHESGTRAVMMTPAPTPGTVIRAFGTGCHGVCDPDADTDALAIAIRAAKHGHGFICPGAARAIIDRYLRRSVEDTGHHGSLTRRQREVLRMVAQGLRTKEIATTLCLSTKTVESHRAAIMRRLGVSRVVELVHEASRLGLVPPPE